VAREARTYEQTPQGRVDYTYDDAGRRQTMTALGQPSVIYSWDNIAGTI